MRSRLPLLVLLTSALAFLVSLYLPWEGGTGPPLTTALDGWSAEAAAVAALVALALGGTTAAILIRPELAARLPVGSLAVGLGYFAVGIALQLRAESMQFSSNLSSSAAGVWLGLASGGLAAAGGLILRRREVLLRRSVSDALVLVLGVGLLVSLLLPWVRSPSGLTSASYPGVETSSATIAAVVLLLGARWARLPLAIIVATLVAAAATAASFHESLRYGAWVGIGYAVALLVLAAFREQPFRTPPIPRGWAAVRAVAAFGLVVALFLPWLTIAIPHHTFGLNGWEFPGAPAGFLALLLLAAPTLPYMVETVAAIAFLVAWIGGTEAAFLAPGSSFGIAYGSYVGFAATALLLLTVLGQLRPTHVDRRRALRLGVPIAACIASLGAVVVPTWDVLPASWSFEAYAVSDWLAVAGLLLALYLIRAWTRGGRRTLAALALLTFPVLHLIRERDQLGLAWGAWILIGLCLLLVLLGWIEERGGGLESFRLPAEIWRVDRLPGES